MGLPSLQKVFDEHFSEDTALVQAPDSPTESASLDEVAAYKAAIAEHRRLLAVARETGDWSALRVAGAGDLATFKMRPINADQLSYLRSLHMDDDPFLMARMAFRASVVGVEGIDGVGPRLKDWEDHPELGRIATTSFLDGVHPAFALRLMIEIGTAAFQRAITPSPRR